MTENSQSPQGPVTQTDVKLAEIKANVTNIKDNVNELKQKMEKHMESSEGRTQKFVETMHNLVADMKKSIDAKFDEMSKKIENQKEEHDKKLSFMRSEVFQELDKKVPYKDFKTVWAVVGAVIVVA